MFSNGMIYIAFLTLLNTLMTIAGFMRGIWWFSPFDFFRLQYAILSAILLVASIYVASPIFIIINSFIVAVNLYRIRSFLPNLPHWPKQDTNKTIFSVNAYKENNTPHRLARLIKKTNPQLMLIMEMTEFLDKALVKELSDFAYRLQTPVRDGFSICLLSKNPLEDENISYYGAHKTPLLSAKTNINGQHYQIYSAHPKPALNKKWADERQEYFDAVKDVIASHNNNLPVIVMGDFNSVPWESHFVDFMNKTGLSSTIKDQGYKVTWPAHLPFLGIPMDHILVSKDIKYNNLQVGPFVGSDHFPLSINL